MRCANSPHMRLWPAAIAVLLISACGPRPPAPLVEFRDSARGFVVRHPPDWTAAPRDDTVWFVPRNADRIPEIAEFIVVVSRASTKKLDDADVRRAVFDFLPIHGVSGFQQDARTTAQILWYKFEVTGASGGEEWASVGAVTAGDARYHVVVCAKPLSQWRNGQKQCDEVVRTFQPGDLQ